METKIKNEIKISADLLRGNIWLNGLFGIEKENVRVNSEGKLSLTPHPEIFGDKIKHPYITTDFSESQIEMITPPLPTIKQSIGFLETIHDIVSLELKDEYLWSQSMPPLLPDEERIPIARFGPNGHNAEEYRYFLASKYGRKTQMISGIHFNYSFGDRLLKALYELNKNDFSFEEFKEIVYLKTARQLLRYRWLYILLFGISPVVDGTAELKCGDYPFDVYQKKNMLSIRNSCFGYRNREELFPNYSSAGEYVESVNEMVRREKLYHSKELYSPVRLKFETDTKNISHLELRFIDIDPTLKAGVSGESLHFLHLLIIFSLLKEEERDFDKVQQSIANSNQINVSHYGLENDFVIRAENGKEKKGWSEARNVLKEMYDMFISMNIEDEGYLSSLIKVNDLTENPERRTVLKVIEEMSESGFINYSLNKAIEYDNESRKKSYNLIGFEDMELSTQLLLREAVRRGVKFDILDYDEHFVRFEKEGNVKHVIQATKTSLDNYAGILAMENKVVTKMILEKKGIRTPAGSYYRSSQEVKNDFHLFEEKAIVIKPKLTNFGKGITIIKSNEDEEMFYRAVDIAFEYDSSILIEEFVEGKEFRFFVIGDEVVGILHRVPANVKGDGIKTIRELVIEKNKDPLRGKGYRTPLEKINIGEAEELFLKTQKIDFDYVPGKNEIVYLRENSNISTGGDSIDYTDDVHESYKRIAIEATRALNVKITGLDMMITDFRQEASRDNYAVIELNFNPAIHIHCFPYKGKNRKLNEKIMNALGY